MRIALILTLLLTACGGERIEPAPQYVDDSVTCTLGHEVMHAALGRYHK